MKIVIDILQTKGHDVWSVHPDSTVYEALQLMAEKKVGALLVIEDNRVVGVFSERDYARKVRLMEKSSLDTAVKEIMSDKVFFVRPEQTLVECMSLMTRQHIRHLPVMEDQELVGVISIGDIVKEIIDDQNLELRKLENYIGGRGNGAYPLIR